MMKYIPIFALSFTLGLYPFLNAQAAQTPSTFIQGHLCSQAMAGAPAPGLLVSLVHPELGRSAPVYTDRFGNFSMGNIPILNTPYYMEVYWGQRLIYRNMISITGPVQLPNICL
jgi:hypothetical protein